MWACHSNCRGAVCSFIPATSCPIRSLCFCSLQRFAQPVQTAGVLQGDTWPISPMKVAQQGQSKAVQITYAEAADCSNSPRFLFCRSTPRQALPEPPCCKCIPHPNPKPCPCCVQGYSKAGQTADAEAAIRWATDYLLECNVADGTFVGQVGTYASDAAYWGKPEVMTENRWGLL